MTSEPEEEEIELISDIKAVSGRIGYGKGGNLRAAILLFVYLHYCIISCNLPFEVIRIVGKPNIDA